jgi:hypothetical protein
MRSVKFFCIATLLALTVSASCQSTNSNFTVTRNDFPATKTGSEIPVTVKESGPSLMLNSVSLSAPTVVGGNIVQGRVNLNMPAPFDLEVSLAVGSSFGRAGPSSNCQGG